MQTNGITVDGVTLGDQSATTGGQGTGYSTLVYVQHSFAGVLRRVNGYSSQPASGPATTSLILLDGNTAYNRLEGPFTRQAASGFGAITHLVTDRGIGNYGVEQAAGGRNANAAISFADTWEAGADQFRFRKSSSGIVALSGAVQRAPGGAKGPGPVLTLPSGFRPATAERFVVASDAGVATVAVATDGVLSIVSDNGAPAGLVYVSGVAFLEAKHDELLSVA